jgi:hypothetical protein
MKKFSTVDIRNSFKQCPICEGRVFPSLEEGPHKCCSCCNFSFESEYDDLVIVLSSQINTFVIEVLADMYCVVWLNDDIEDGLTNHLNSVESVSEFRLKLKEIQHAYRDHI